MQIALRARQCFVSAGQRRCFVNAGQSASQSASQRRSLINAGQCGPGQRGPNRSYAASTGSGSSRHAGAGSMLPLSAPSALGVLAEGFQAQAGGSSIEALIAYRRVQKARSPLLRALAGNAEGLLLLRVPEVIPTITSRDGGNDIVPLESCEPGDAILAPWAEDGAEYAATIASVNGAAGECVVDWDDGGDTHRVVPLASLATLRGGVCAYAVGHNSAEVSVWAGRRAMRRSLDFWEMQAELGTAHDAFVDLVGLLSDTALAEVKAGLASPSRWLTEGLGHALRHLRRARYLAERAYRPDARALAVICMHRAEVLRISARQTAAVEEPSAAAVEDQLPVNVGSITEEEIGARLTKLHKRHAPAGSEVKEGFEEMLELHARAATYIHGASWNVQNMDSSWSPVGGNSMPVVVHELLWAKALATQAVSSVPATPRPKRRATRHPDVRRPRVRKLVKGQYALPEKLLPTPDPATALAPLLEECPARAAATRAWRALCTAAGEAISPERRSGGLWTANGAEAKRLAAAVSEGSMGSRLLLEVAVIVFAMGCRLGLYGWARGVAAPLAEMASKQLDARAVHDDAALAARHTAAVLAGTGVPAFHGKQVSRPLLLAANVGTAGGDSLSEGLDIIKPSRWMRWRLVGYSVTEELWTLRMGARKTVHLAAPPPLTWYKEGLALSETMPESERSPEIQAED